MNWRHFTIVTLLVLAGVQTSAAAIDSGSNPYRYNTSARFWGLGGAGVAAPWSSATNHWANPALLAYRDGLTWESFNMKLARGLADDIQLDSNELLLGRSGFGLVWSHWPLDGQYLDLGDQEGMDENGDPTGVFHSYTQSQSFGLGLDLAPLADRFLIKADSDFQLQRWFSCSVGYVWKSYQDQLSDDEIIQDQTGGEKAEASTHDLGLVLSLTPVNTLNGEQNLGFLLGGAYGIATLNGGDQTIDYTFADISSLFPRAHLNGWSVHGEMAVSSKAWLRNAPGLLASIYETFNPLVSFTYSYQKSQPGYLWDEDTQQYIYERDKSGLYDEIGKGWELGLANVFYLRRGNYEDDLVEGDTEGWGLNLQVGAYGGMRYDKATVPVPDNNNVSEDRESWAFWVCPARILGL